MKNMPSLLKRTLVLAGALTAMSGTLAQASVINKANNSDNLNLTTSWLGGVVPGASDIAAWNSTVTGANTVNLGASTAWLGIQIANPGGLVTIANDSNTLTNGLSGIDMSAAAQNLALNNNVVLGSGPQNWTLASGRALTLGASLLRQQSSGLRFYLPDLNASGAQVSLTNGTPNWLLGGTTNSTFGNLYFATINDVDLAALNGSMQVVGESTVSSLQVNGLVQHNQAGANPTQNTNCLVEVFDNTGSYGTRTSGSETYSSWLFNTPQTYNVIGTGNAIFYKSVPAWQVSHTSGRNITTYTILISTNVGPSAVFDDGGATLIIGTAGTRDLLLYQNNPAAPLVLQNVVTESQANFAFLNKFGVGTVELENQNSYSGGTEIYEGTLKVDAIGDQSLYALTVGGATTAQNTYGSLGISYRTNGPGAVIWTNSVNVYGGILTQAAPNTNAVPITVYGGATNAISISRANLQVLDGSSSRIETTVNSSTNFALTFNNGSHLQFVYANGVAPSATVVPLLVTNAYSTANLSLVANGTVTVDVLSGSLSLGQFPLIKYSGAIGGTGGSAFVLGTIEPHASGFISNNLANNSIDLVVTNITQPLTWNGGTGTWDIGITANWNDNEITPVSATYQQIGSLADNVVFDDSSSGTSPLTVTLNVNPIPASVTVNNASKTYTISGNGGISGLGRVIKTGTGTLFLQTTNTFTGGLNVNGGILNFTTITNLGNGGINFGGGTLQFASGTVDDISVRPVTFNAGSGTIDLNGNAVTFANAIGNNGAGGFTLTGNNTLQINLTNLYSGNTIINSGSTLAFQSANTYIGNSAALVVNGTLDASANVNPNGFGLTLSTPVSQMLAGTGNVKGEISMGSGTAISPATNGVYGTLSISGDLTINGGALVMDIAGPSGASKDLIAINNTGFGGGNLTLGSGLNAGTIQLNVSGTLNNGTYTLITYSGSLIGAAGNLNLAGFTEAGHLAYLTSSGNAINLVVISANTNSVVWGTSGLNNNAWDVHNSANWVSNGVTGQVYDNGDTATFDDSGLASQPVRLGDNGVSGSGTIIPGSVTLNVTNNNYTFQDGVGDGSGKLLGAAALTINSVATNTTTILTANGNSGPTTLKAGTLQVGNGTTTGDIGTGSITNNGTLIFDQTDVRTVQGQISGTGNLIQEGLTNLALLANNSYSGLTIISNASSTLQVGSGGAVGSLGSGAVTDNGLLSINRSGSVTLANISGSGSVAVAGGPTITLSGLTLTYLGNTFINSGSVTLAAANQIPNGVTVSGSTGIFGLGGRLDLAGFNQTVNGLTDLGVNTGLITNSAASGTNVLTIGIPSVNTTNTYSGLIMDNTNRAGIALVIKNPGTTILTGQGSTFRGGIIVGLGTLQLGQGGPNINGGVSSGSGAITMSNGTTLFMGGNNITFVPNPVIIAPNSTVTFSEQLTAAYSDTYSGAVSGDANSTNVIGNQFTMQGTAQWNGFFGTVVVPNGQGLRMYGATGGTNTTFEIDGSGSLFSRDATMITLGALTGNGNISPPSNPTATYVIGSKGIDSTFIGSISGANNIVKTGAGTLTLNGSTNIQVVTGPDDSGNFSTNYISTNGLSYTGSTTVSNGVLAIVAPANLNGANFTAFTLAGSTAVLDLSSAGYTPDGTNYVTNSVLTLVSPQTLGGFGTIRGSVVAGSGTTLNPGNPAGSVTNGTSTGVLTVTNSIEIGGAVFMRLDRTNAVTGDEIASPTITIDGTATLLVTNVGPGLFNGDTFTLFSQGVSGFASKTLPATDPTGLTNYVWTDTISSNGKITLASGGLPSIATNPTNIVFGATNGMLTMSWPTDHTGWFLQAQTNLLTTGLSTNWVNVIGSDQTNLVVMPINPTNGTVFYRMIH